MFTADATAANRRVATYEQACRTVPLPCSLSPYCPVHRIHLEAQPMSPRNPSSTRPAAPQSSPQQEPVAGRRRLFTGLGAAGAAAAAATLLPGCAPVEPAPVAAKPAPEKGGGYQLTQHVQRYYQTAKV